MKSSAYGRVGVAVVTGRGADKANATVGAPATRSTANRYNVNYGRADALGFYYPPVHPY